MLHVIFSLVAIVPLFSPSRDRSTQSVIKTLVVEEQEVNKLLTAESWPQLRTLLGWSNRPEDARVRIAKRLLPLLHSNARVALGETAGIMIPYRVITGEMKADPKLGPGNVVPHDLFLIGGRAAWGVDILLKSERFIILDGGLTPAEWNERALKIEARVKDFAIEVAKPKKPPVPLHRTRGWSSPHVVPAVNGVLAMRALFTPADDAWGTFRVVQLTEEQQVNAMLTQPDWPMLKELWVEWEIGSQDVQVRLALRLLPHLRDTTRVPLNDAGDLLLPHRLKTGELLPSPKRLYQAQHDVFLKGGRAAYGLRAVANLNDASLALDGGLTVDDWDKRAARIETLVKAFVERNTPKPPKK